MTWRGVVTTDLGSALADGDAPPTDRDLVELRSFQRWLWIAPPAGEEPGWIPRRAAGWIPYVLGLGPAPPEGMDDVHPTAWTVPA